MAKQLVLLFVMLLLAAPARAAPCGGDFQRLPSRYGARRAASMASSSNNKDDRLDHARRP